MQHDKNETPTQLFSCENCYIFKNTLFYRISLVAAHEILSVRTFLYILAVRMLFRILEDSLGLPLIIFFNYNSILVCEYLFLINGDNLR